MSAAHFSITVTPELHSQIAELVQLSGKSEQEVVREAIEAYRGQQAAKPTAYDVAKQAGWFEREERIELPHDLATNPIHMEGFGRD